MKLLFFIVALGLVMLAGYYSITGRGRNDNNNGTVTVTNGDYYEQVKWSGKIELSEDENSIDKLAPGGYLKFRENDAKMIAESNLQGEISYTLYDGNSKLALDDSGRHFIRASLKKMIARGFYSGGRAERINSKGGYQALIAELPNLKMDNIKGPYLDLLFRNDSLSSEELAVVIRQAGSSVSDNDKENFLKRISSTLRKDSSVSAAWLDLVAGFNADMQKVNLLSYLIDKDSLTDASFIRIMDISIHLNADIDKQRIYGSIADKGNITENQWMLIIDAAGHQNADMDKSNLLLRFAQKMPHTEKIKAAYLEAAKKINNDADYGRAVKIIE